MRITVKSSSVLRQHLPGGAAQAEIEVPEGATPIDVMNQLGFDLEEPYLTMLNGELLPPAKRAETVLKPGDLLAVFPPLKGG